MPQCVVNLLTVNKPQHILKVLLYISPATGWDYFFLNDKFTLKIRLTFVPKLCPVNPFNE